MTLRTLRRCRLAGGNTSLVQALRWYLLALLLICSLDFVFAFENVGSQLPTSDNTMPVACCCAPCHAEPLPSRTVSWINSSSCKLFMIMSLYYCNSKVTSTALKIPNKENELISFSIWSNVPLMILEYSSSLFLCSLYLVKAYFKEPSPLWFQHTYQQLLELTFSRFKTAGAPLLFLRIPEVKIISKGYL